MLSKIRKHDTYGSYMHPGIMPLHDLARVEGMDGMCMIMPKYAIDLEKAVQGNALDNKSKLKITFKLLDALHFLHKNHIIHRDIKTANVLLDDDMNPILADFSLVGS